MTTPEPTIGEEGIDAAAAAAFFQDDVGGHIKGRWTWDTIPEEGRDNYRKMVRAAITAALPYLATQRAQKDDPYHVGHWGDRFCDGCGLNEKADPPHDANCPHFSSRRAPDERDYCGCCGDEIPGPGTGRNWCNRCVLHLGPTNLPPWERTYESQHDRPCPFQVGSRAPDEEVGEMEREILMDLWERLTTARLKLTVHEANLTTTIAAARLYGKTEGVSLALSYLNEALATATPPDPTPSPTNQVPTQGAQ